MIQMYVLVCRETGLDCDFIIKGEIQKHGINANDIYLNDTPVNLLCHSF